MSKYIFVCGGVISGIGKGVASASLGLLMKLRGHKIQIIKLDPYLNLNAGILAPREHGECFLCDDGSETDLDLGHYSRLVGIDPSGANICTSGTLFKEIIEEQENGKWLGSTIQLNPHVTNKIQDRLEKLGEEADIVLVEIGGTVGDAESNQFYEAIRQFKLKKGDDVIIVLVSPILWVEAIEEFKTKPLQNSVRELQRCGISPDILLCRTDKPVDEDILDKISNLTSVPRESVFEAPTVKPIYRIPIEFYNQHIDDLITDKFRLRRNSCKIHKYRELVERELDGNITVAVFGKYDNCTEAYMSLKEAIYHATLSHSVNLEIKWINAEKIEKTPAAEFEKLFSGVDAIIVPGGFDKRGVEGKIKAIEMARKLKIPFLGICLGLQCSVIEFARNVCNIDNPNSLEFDKSTPNPVVHFVKGQEDLKKKSGTMRLGAWPCDLSKDTLAYEVYGKKSISERHRHRYEINNSYAPLLEKNGLIVSGINPGSGLIEVMELRRELHPYFIATQAHPEFKSKLMEPHPLFKGLIGEAKKYQLETKHA